MVRIWLLPIVPLTLFFAVMIGLVYSQPYQERDIFAFLVPSDDCPAPCWEGIRPGLTTADEAIDRLEAHPWVDHIIINQSFAATSSGFIGWVWNGQQPDPINGSTRGTMWVQNGVVESVRIPTTIPFGALWLHFQRPSKGVFLLESTTLNADYTLVHYAAYPQYRFVAWNELACPLRSEAFWRGQVTIQFTNGVSSELADYELPGWIYQSPCR